MSNSRYEAGASTVEQMLAPDSTVFEIPEFQRGYAWKAEEVEKLLDDLYIEENWHQPDQINTPYFLGSIVLSKIPNGPDSVLDGQQRLTTISLLLATLRYKLKQLGDTATASDIQKFLVSGKIGQQKAPKVKLQPNDAKVFSQLIDDPSQRDTVDSKKNPLVRALKKIDEATDHYVKEAGQRGVPPDECLRWMATKILYGVEFVRIVAPSESEAFRLFETLNDRGLPLSAADLIKNKLFAQCGNHLPRVKELWQEMIDNVGMEDVVGFLRYVWIAQYRDVRKDSLYDVFEQQIRKNRPDDVLNFVQQLHRISKHYQHIAAPDPKTCPWGSEAGEGLVRLNAFRARSCRSVLIACADDPHLHTRMPFLIRACESITIRYSVVGERNPNSLERAYGNVCQRIRNSGQDADLEKILIEEIRSVPGDTEFENQFALLDIERITTTWRVILIRLNEMISTGETRISGTKNVEVEHIFPKNPKPAACNESNIPKERVSEVVGRIGNITLLSGRKNREMQNWPFSRKQPVFASSEIKLSQQVAEYSSWHEEDIEKRSRELAQIAVETWPWPVM